MKNLLLAVLLLLPIFHKAFAQVTCDPVFPTTDDNVTIYFDATQGNAALANVPAPIYVHIGVITNLSTSGTDWKHVVTTWGTPGNNATSMMELVSTGHYKKSFNIRTFFSIPANETVQKLACVFRNADGSIVARASDGTDIFYPVYAAGGALLTTILQPSDAFLLKNMGEKIEIKGAASQMADLTLFDNDVQIAAASNTNALLDTITTEQTGLHTVAFVAKTSTQQDTSFFTYIVQDSIVSEDPPAGTELGLNVLDNQHIRLALYAPSKQVVYAIGDFSDWAPLPQYQMKRSLDGKTWWVDIDVTPGQAVRYQYFVDGTLKVADPYSELVLDPWNDSYIPAITYPSLPAYPSGKTTGIVSIYTTGLTPFNWQASNYQRPKKTDLVVYELLVRDFLARHDYQTVLDTLDYLQKLGITAIELMPVNEFDGNINWGYSPAFHKALDKYYGSSTALKTLIDACHSRGIAVVLDVVFNHATGASPLAQLYWDGTNNRPAANNPWLNPVAKHDFNVYNDFNHESLATKYYTKRCVKYWMEEYHVDGFRFDLSKGFTQKNTLGNTGAWGQYDASRVTIWKDYADYMFSIDPSVYIILEHFADNSEEKILADYGMMLWGNANGQFKDVALGFAAAQGTSLTGISYKSRTWANPHLVGYMESHDEERIAYECKTNGNASGGYNIKSLATGMARIEMLNNLFYTVPGPKMLWQFGELGYDFSINTCPNGTINNGCRTDPKPIRWDYAQNVARKHLHDQTQALLHLRNTQDLFETTDFQMISNTSGKGRLIRLSSTDLHALAMANVAMTTENIPTWFHHAGWWYDYYTGDSINVTVLDAPLSLQHGEYRLYLDKYIPLPDGIELVATKETSGELNGLNIFPNPTAEMVNLDFALLQGTQVMVELFDMTGKRVQIVANQTFAAGEQHLEMDLAGQPAGVYFLKLSTGTGAFLGRKVVKF